MVAAFLTMLIAVIFLVARKSERAVAPMAGRTSPAPASRSTSTTIPTMVTSQDRVLSALGPELVDHPEAANDVVFLAMAAAYGRCVPSHAHELGAMAARAHLPVLKGLGDVIDPRHESRAAVLAGLRDLAGRVPCSGPMELVLGDFRQRIDMSAYVAAFPDSYVDPAMTTVPEAFAGRTLAVRTDDPCTEVSYAVLPLDPPRAWQCGALRADARKQVLALCGQGDQATTNDGAQGADAVAMAIRDTVERLPATCR